jgi:hypothetical protein
MISAPLGYSLMFDNIGSQLETYSDNRGGSVRMHYVSDALHRRNFN